jgi:hypothetical protein
LTHARAHHLINPSTPLPIEQTQDVTSYLIARTLGVVDDVKASTSDADTTADGRHIAVAAVSACAPKCACSSAPARASGGLAPEDSGGRRPDGDGDGDAHGCVSQTGLDTSVAVHARSQTRDPRQSQIQSQTADEGASDALPQAYYFAGEEGLRLAGEGVFSPAVSMPPSPLTPRIPLHTFTDGDGRGSGQVSEEEGIVLRRRVHGAREDKLGHT